MKPSETKKKCNLFGFDTIQHLISISILNQIYLVMLVVGEQLAVQLTLYQPGEPGEPGRQIMPTTVLFAHPKGNSADQLTSGFLLAL